MNETTLNIRGSEVVLSKRYYTIGEVSKMFDVATSLLRFWEGTFTPLHPGKNKKGIRQYTIKDVEVVHRIYHLTKEKGYTIDGAKQAFYQISKTTKIELLNSKLTKIKQDILAYKNEIEE